MTSFEIPDSDLEGIKDQVVIITGEDYTMTYSSSILTSHRRLIWYRPRHPATSHQTWRESLCGRPQPPPRPRGFISALSQSGRDEMEGPSRDVQSSRENVWQDRSRLRKRRNRTNCVPTRRRRRREWKSSAA